MEMRLNHLREKKDVLVLKLLLFQRVVANSAQSWIYK
jgi:hypothetical protein